MKKIVSLLLLSILACSQIAFAAENLMADEAQKLLISVKERIGDTSVFDRFESSSTDNETNKNYRFYWSTSENENYSSLNVTCNSDGIITNYYLYRDSGHKVTKPSINKLSQEEAMKKTYVLISKLNPSISDKVMLVKTDERENFYSNDFSFEIKHIENGVEVYGDGGYVTVDINADEIKSYRITYTSDIEYESLEKIISIESAKKAYSENLGLEMQYDSVYRDNELKIVPVYTEKSENNNKYINALNGDVYEYNFESVEKSMASDGASGGAVMNAAMREESFTDAEIEELEKIEDFLSKEEIIEILKKNKYIPLPSDYTLSSFRTSKSYHDETKRLSTLNFRNKDNNSINYTVDSKTAEITNYYSYENYDINAEKLTKDEAKKTLKDSVIGISGDCFKEFGTEVYYYPEINENSKYTSPSATLSYTRMVNGIPYLRDYISISVNIYTGKIENYSIKYNEAAAFPSIENAISYETAVNTLFNELDYNICYMISGKKAVPVYKLDDKKSIVINAINGKFLNHSLEEYDPIYVGYNDISNHYAKDAIEKLAEFGIYFEGDSYLPDTPIKQKEFIYILNCCFGYNSPEPRPIDSVEKVSAYNTLSLNSIIHKDEIDHESTVTREDAAKFLIRAMGYEDVAELNGIYIVPFSDVNECVGYISILKAMKIVNGNGDGTFEPKKTLTRAQAALMIYNYLSM